MQLDQQDLNPTSTSRQGVVCFGELLLRLSTRGYRRLSQASSLDVHYGGAEYNVAAALAQMGVRSCFVSRLPGHALGDAALSAMRESGVITSHIVRGIPEERLGQYFLEPGFGLRSSKVIYDRANTAFCALRPQDFDWNAIFEGSSWFHWTGITPALGEAPQHVLVQACEAAKSAGVRISVDLNYRHQLWSEAEAQSVMPDLISYADVCIGSEDHVSSALGVKLPADAPAERNARDTQLAQVLKSRFDFRTVALTRRSGNSASRNEISMLLHDDTACAAPQLSSTYRFDMVDRVGGGDAFSAGLIYGLLHFDDSREALEFGAAAGALKHSIPGDVARLSVAEIQRLRQTGSGGRMQR